jgi:hypothetical protein
MDWASRELQVLQDTPPSILTSGFNNAHNFFSRCGILEQGGEITRAGNLTTSVFGLTYDQRSLKLLQRAFEEFIVTLEEAVKNELDRSVNLANAFGAIEQQFNSIARLAIREFSLQDSGKDDVLASLWTKILGKNAKTLKKFEANKKLLNEIREKTLDSKIMLLDHTGRLRSMKFSLETLRRKLVSPLVRAEGTTVGIGKQIKGILEVHQHLKNVRLVQREKVNDLIFSAESRKAMKKQLAGRYGGKVDRS